MIAAEVCSTQRCIAASMANNSTFLPALLAVNPLQTFPVDSLLHQNPSDSPEPSILPQAEPVVKSLLLLAQLMIAAAAERNSIFANIADSTDSTEGGLHLRSAIVRKLQQLTDLSCCTPVLLTDSTTQSQTCASQPLPKPSKRISILRSAVLMLKLATLTFNVKADACGHVNVDRTASAQPLWRLIVILADKLQVSSRDASTGSGNATKKKKHSALLFVSTHLRHCGKA